MFFPVRVFLHFEKMPLKVTFTNILIKLYTPRIYYGAAGKFKGLKNVFYYTFMVAFNKTHLKYNKMQT